MTSTTEAIGDWSVTLSGDEKYGYNAEATDGNGTEWNYDGETIDGSFCHYDSPGRLPAAVLKRMIEMVDNAEAGK